MDFEPVLISVTTLLSASIAAFVAYRLGRGAAREDRLRTNELRAIEDTRDRLLDVVRLADGLTELGVDKITAVSELVASLRYPRARHVLIADDRLIGEMERTLPAVLRTFPSASYELRADVGRLANAVREAMYDQEKAVLRTGKPKLQTPEQERRLDAMDLELAALQSRFRGWSRVRMRLTIFRRLTFGF